MNITEVRVKLTEAKKNRLMAFCSITIDNDFVVRDLKIIEGYKGAFVAMPSRKLADKCTKCGCKNHLRSRFCNDCGAKLDDKRAIGDSKEDSRGKFKLYADTAHPINSKCRDEIEQKVLAAYKEESDKAQQPGYVPPVMDEPDLDYDEDNTNS
ncbi:MAG: stage V sporulation protein G [Candidatus Brocadiaceae bacterium]|nr:stage V sporulation protein G [Candidatus Brocadiaceae bacterium]